MKTISHNDKSQKQLRELVAALVLQFILGVALTTVVNYDQQKPSLVQNTVLGLHIVIGTFILVVVIIRLVHAYQWKAQATEPIWGLGSVVIAFLSGSIAAQSGNTWATFIMALGFVVALFTYGKSLKSLTP